MVMRLDEGPESVRIWPVVESTNGRGNIVRTPAPDDQAVDLPVWVQEIDGMTAKIWRSSLPTGPWGKARRDGRDWDIEGDVQMYRMNGKQVSEAVLKARAPRPVPGG